MLKKTVENVVRIRSTVNKLRKLFNLVKVKLSSTRVYVAFGQLSLTAAEAGVSQFLHFHTFSPLYYV